MATKAPALRDFLAERLSTAPRGHKEPATRAAALVDVIAAVAQGAAEAAVALRTTLVQKVQTTNEFGDDVLTADLVADKRIASSLERCSHVASYASEEHPELTKVRPAADPSSMFTVTYDPLDGSSIIDTNFSVGAIFGIWNGATCIGQAVRDMPMSAVAVFGPRTTLFVAHASFGVHEFLLMTDAGDWRLVRSEPFDVKPKAKFFSPGNLRASNDLPAYRAFLKAAVRDKMTLRYTGGMVPDVTQILIKGSGVFSTPTAARFKVKLRVCFECGPLSHMITCAGGKALDEQGRLYADVVVTQMDQRSGVVLGSSESVDKLRDALTCGSDPSESKL
jgi:sedoheptulose-bisphosphatase